MNWGFDNTYARDLEGFYLDWAPAPSPKPRLIDVNDDLARELDLDPEYLRSDDGIAVLAGNEVPGGSHPLAQAYAGHQFGHYSPLLGDGRALLLGEVIDAAGNRRDIAFKGSGRTRFSRGGDGKAAIGPVLREYVVAEAMHALGIPTTRALAAVSTGEIVPRDGRALQGAILTRVAASHLRVGTFELVARNGGIEQLRRLADYAMARHYPDLEDGDYAGFLSAVVERQATLVAQWMSVGFIHGVMNTDNMTISGETIDYGPCAFMEAYDDNQVFSSIDTGGRYRYSQQPPIVAWNLSRLAETLIPLIVDAGAVTADEAVADATNRVEQFFALYEAERLTLFTAKLGLPEADAALIDDLLQLMAANRLDFTLTFRNLARVLRGERDAVRENVVDIEAYDAWQHRWLDRIDDGEATADAMDSVNPLYIPRNHLVEQALEAAQNDDLQPFEQLLSVIREPYAERPAEAMYAEPAPLAFTSGYITYCGT